METRILFMVMLIITSLINFDSNAFIRNTFVPKTPRRIALCSGRVISPSITLLRNDSLEVLGKCYGYVNCTACTTCNFCGYCNSGGSCGVCGKRYSSPSPLPNPKPIPKAEEEKEPPKEERIKKMYINEDNINLRSDPYYNSNVIGKLRFGEVVDSLRRSFYVQDVFPYGKAYWCLVRTKDNVEGWVFSKLLVSEEDLLYNEKSEKLKIEDSFCYINGNNVNIRKGPGKNYSVIAMLNYNEICKIMERTVDKENIKPYGEYYWYKISKGDIQGWIFGRFLREEANEVNVKQGIINGRFVNVRLKPDISSVVMGRVYKDEKCIVLEKSENETYLNNHGSFYWYKIRTNRNEGWIFGKFIEF